MDDVVPEVAQPRNTEARLESPDHAGDAVLRWFAVKTSAYLARYRHLVHRHCRLDHDSSLQ